MAEMIYTETNSRYKEKNPTWHVEDSEWKATQILKMMERNRLNPKKVAEIGCGAGEILNQLDMRMGDKNVEFSGYEISPDAYELCRERGRGRLRFFQEDLLESKEKFDLMLMIDVFEHVEDCYGFIRKAKERAAYTIYHIPLDIAHLNLLTNRLMKQRKAVGHIHYFTKDTALATIEDSGHEIVDWFYTKYSQELYNKGLSKMGQLFNFLRRVTYSSNPDLSASLFGGYSLIVLAKNKQDGAGAAGQQETPPGNAELRKEVPVRRVVSASSGERKVKV